jgi:putative transposase
VRCFRFVAAKKAEHSVKTMCRVLGVSRSGFHAWEQRPACERELSDRRLIEQIRRVHARSRGTYGARRVHAALRHQGVRVGRKRVERLMRRAQLSGLARRRRAKTTIRVAGVRCVPDLVDRDFQPAGPDRLWVADITYVRTWQGWLYLAAVLDCYSRRVVGWSLADHMRSQLVVDALEMAVGRRRPAAGLVHHSDHGSQFVSLVFGQRCRQAGIAVSMGSKGDCYDNSVAESFFATLKKDLIHRHSWPTKTAARTAIFEFIEAFYNRERLHSTIGYLSPHQYEQLAPTQERMNKQAA